MIDQITDSTNLSRSEHVYQLLREELIRGGMSDGVRIYESAVADRLNASRTPVREALQRLMSSGLLQRRGRAYVTPEITFDWVSDIYSVREALESKAIEALGNAQDRLGSLDTFLNEMDAACAAQDPHRFNLADIGFHLELAQLSGNPLLETLLESVLEKVLFVRSTVFAQPDRLRDAVTEHRRIVHALERGQVSVAAEEMRDHLRSVPKMLRTAM